MRVPDTVKDCVTFLAVKKERDDDVVEYKYGGTAFFVSVDSKARQGWNFLYLVTAKHNVVTANGDVRDLYLRFNTQDGGSSVLKVEADWHFPDAPEDEAVDVAVAPIAPPLELFKYTHLPIEMCATDEIIKEHGIGIGDDLLIVGLFALRHGSSRNLPIVRTGIIASMPDEPLLDKNTGLEFHSYFAEVRSISGLSGSPVFVFLDPGRVHENKIMNVRRGYLLGVIRGHWKYDTKDTALDYAVDELKEVNAGIANVTPIQEVLKIINGAELMKMRSKREREMLEEDASAHTLDSAFDEPSPAGQKVIGITQESFEDALKRASRKLPSQPDEEKK